MNKIKKLKLCGRVSLIFLFLLIQPGTVFCQQAVFESYDSLQEVENKSPSPLIIYINYFDPGQDTSWFLGSRSVGPINFPGSIWQIGKPMKPFPLDTTLSPPNVLITDTVNPYPINTYSSFEMHFGRYPGYEHLCWSHMLLGITYKIDVDSAHDGVFIEIMYNGDGNWKNIVFDNNADHIIGNWEDPHGTYSPYDSLFNGEPGISHNNPNTYDPFWKINNFVMSWDWDDNNAHNIDSVSFRITFISDSINDNKGGFLIESIDFHVDHLCTASLENLEATNQIILYPNPAQEGSAFDLKRDSKYEIFIWNIIGQCVLHEQGFGQFIPVGNIYGQPGLFSYKIILYDSEHYGKFLVNPK